MGEGRERGGRRGRVIALLLDSYFFGNFLSQWGANRVMNCPVSKITEPEARFFQVNQSVSNLKKKNHFVNI